MSIIKDFIDFGRITKIDSEFKSRVYEKFLRKDSKQKKLGQYLTPRVIVRTIIKMANIQKLMRDGNKSICDPASGVGGFLLEGLLHEGVLESNLKIEGNKLTWRVELVGLEVDRQTNILAKANMLIHLAEIYKESSEKQKKSFVELMNRTFLLTDHTKVLGSLEFPQKNRFDLIITNPPFTVSGTKVIKKQISEQAELKTAYEQAGIGTESLFLRWIIDALKPNCQAFVIVPTGILARTEILVKDYLLRHCELDAIISLPENTFYNTANPTYIICFTKKENPSPTWEQNKDVFCYIVREIGETRDTLRFPCKTDLNDLVRQFRAFYADKDYFESRTLNCKIVDRASFKPENRWDIDDVFWTEEEKIQLGLTDVKTIDITHFESELDATIESIKIDLADLKTGKDDTINIVFKELSLGDSKYFEVIRGERITRSEINKNPGEIPVISSSGKENGYLGHISREWLIDNEHPLI